MDKSIEDNMDSKYSYDVWRKGDDAFYNIKRSGELVDEQQVSVFDIPLFKYMSLTFASVEKRVKVQLSVASERAKFAVKTLEEIETI